MRCLVLTRYDAIGASSRLRTLQYLPLLQAHGIDTEVFPLLGDGYVEDLYADRVSPSKVVRSYLRRFRILRAAKHYDAVWVEKELLPWLPVWVETGLLAAGATVVVDYDDAVFHRYDQHRSLLIRMLLGHKIDRVMCRADLVIAGNDYIAARAHEAGARRMEWLPTVVDLDRYPVPKRREDGGRLVIGWIGSPATAPYLHQLTPALARVAANHAIRCVAIGAREDQVQGTPFEAWPWREDDEVAMLHRCDIGIMPLIDGPWERGKCGYKLIQYMACGLPVVASPVGVNTDIVRPGVNGILAESTSEWTHAFTELLANTNLRRRMGEAGRRRVEEVYSVQVQVRRLAEMLKSIRSRSGH